MPKLEFDDDDQYSEAYDSVLDSYGGEADLEDFVSSEDSFSYKQGSNRFSSSFEDIKPVASPNRGAFSGKTSQRDNRTQASGGSAGASLNLEKLRLDYSNFGKNQTEVSGDSLLDLLNSLDRPRKQPLASPNGPSPAHVTVKKFVLPSSVSPSTERLLFPDQHDKAMPPSGLAHERTDRAQPAPHELDLVDLAREPWHNPMPPALAPVEDASSPLLSPGREAVEDLRAKIEINELVNPFIPESITQLRASTLLPSSMIPDLPTVKTNTNSPYQKIIADAARKQQEAQNLFRNLASPVPPEMARQPSGQATPALQVPKRGISMPHSPSSTRLGAVDHSVSELDYGTHSQRADSPGIGGHSQRSNSPGPFLEEAMARQERLASLGIFDVNPKARTSSRPDPARVPLKSFSTPQHHKPQQLSKDIEEISAPQLVSTSSRMQTVPLKEILRDLKAAGRLVDEQEENRNSEDSSRSSKEKKKFFK
ncbi:hypothetical protein HDV03_001422 [Kappamyces sp. JEL0829]|nr:hypothetical protein HDV03_001422 [Kappamyces sp. JEL0829]